MKATMKTTLILIILSVLLCACGGGNAKSPALTPVPPVPGEPAVIEPFMLGDFVWEGFLSFGDRQIPIGPYDGNIQQISDFRVRLTIEYDPPIVAEFDVRDKEPTQGIWKILGCDPLPDPFEGYGYHLYATPDAANPTLVFSLWYPAHGAYDEWIMLETVPR